MPRIPSNPNPYLEANSSVTFNIQTKEGYKALFSVRGDSGEELLKLMPNIIAEFQRQGIVPQPDRVFGGGRPKEEPKVVEGRKCPKCGNPLVEVKTKTGKTFVKCSTQKYDFATKTTTGCDYISWNQ